METAQQSKGSPLAGMWKSLGPKVRGEAGPLGTGWALIELLQEKEETAKKSLHNAM
jgi:hypothetical protein